MRNPLILIALVAALVLSPHDRAHAIPTFAESFGVDGVGPDSQGYYGIGDDYATSIAAMPDGGVVVVGKLSLPKPADGHTEYLNNDALMRFAPDGTIIWKKSFTATSPFFAEQAYSYVRIVSDAQGNIYLSSILNLNGGAVPYVAKFDLNGNLVWKTNVKVPSPPDPNTGVTSYLNGQFNTISLSAGGKLVLTGSAYPPQNTGHTGPLLTVMNAGTGAVELVRRYENSSIQYDAAIAGCASKDGTKYLFATADNGLTLVLTDTAGVIVNTKNYFNFDNADGRGASTIIPTADGDFLILSGRVIRKVGADQVTVAGVTSTVLVTRFERITSYPPGGSYAYFQTAVQMSDGSYLLGGPFNVTPSDLPGGGSFGTPSGNKAGLFKLDAQGNITGAYALGGQSYEATFDPSTAPGLCPAVPTTDGGYAFATSTLTYRAQTDALKPDWWIAKADATGKIKGFKDIMLDLTSKLSTAPFTNGGPSMLLGTFVPVTLVTETALLPALFFPEAVGLLRIQASPPRILSATSAEAVVGQHFSYHIVAGFFDAGATITYSTTALPAGFVIDPKTGVISGAPAPGTETKTPFLITLNATDGTVSTPPVTLALTIGDGVPDFTVNGSKTAPATSLADSVLSFSAQQPGVLAGAGLYVQATTTPNDGASWQRLSNGTNGYMTYDPRSGRYVLNSTTYPALNGVYFRAVLRAPSRADKVSTAVGPFNLASAKLRAGQTVFKIIRNGIRGDFDFRATQVASPVGVALRVQSSYTPADEGSWTTLTDQRSGSMVADARANHFSLVINAYPVPPLPVYFRALASLSGSVDSLSNVIGPYTLKADTPPLAKITSLSGTGSGTQADPKVVRADESGLAVYDLSVTATSSGPIKDLQILFDGELISKFTDVTSGTLYTTSRTSNRLGDHVVETVASDNLGEGRSASGLAYLRILPAATTAAKAAKSSDETTPQAFTFRKEIYTVAKSGGDWSDPSTWADSKGNPGVPTSTDFVIIGGSTVVHVAGTVYALSIDGGHLAGGQLEVENMLTISNGIFDGSFALTIKAGALCEMVNPKDVVIAGLLQNRGTVNIHGARGLVGVSDFLNLGTVNFQRPLLTSAATAAGLPLDGRSILANGFTNNGKIFSDGKLVATGGGNVVSNDSAGLVATGGGNLISQDGGTLVATGGGNAISDNGAGLVATGGGNLISQDGGTLITNDGGTLISQDGGTLVATGGGNILSPNSANIGPGSSRTQAAATTASSGFTQSGGETDLSGVNIIGLASLNGGTLSGSGLIVGDLTNNSGYISPGRSPGTIAVTGNFSQGAQGTFIVETAGGEPNQSDMLQVGGTATLGGNLHVRPINGYVPLPDDPFVPLSYNSVSGSFASISSNAKLVFNPTGVQTITDPAKPSPTKGQPLNIATRLQILGGDNGLIEGFIITGAPGTTKNVLIRGLGPSTGLAGAITDPILELNGTGVHVVNDDWQQGDTSLIPTGFSPSNAKESVIVATVAPGNYTAILRNVSGQVGIGLTEVYDLDSAGAPQLANIATRGLVQTGDNVMIGGFIIGGTEPAKVLVRVTGPTLTTFGIAGALADPTLELHDSNGGQISNDDWRATQESDIIATTIPPANDKEPAILANLVPGNYTAVVRGVNNTTGVAVVEAYNLP